MFILLNQCKRQLVLALHAPTKVLMAKLFNAMMGLSALIMEPGT
jgi:hypothetical protein